MGIKNVSTDGINADYYGKFVLKLKEKDIKIYIKRKNKDSIDFSI
jgi:hypothetical protein